jgi:ribosomal protein L11 methylase PrmA
MVGSVSNSYVTTSALATTSSSTQSSSSLSSYQQEYIAAVLENYDSSNLSAEDAQEIVSAFKEEGIGESSELASLMEEAGFDAREVGDLTNAVGVQAAGSMPPPPQPPQGGNETSEEEESYISELLDSLLNTDSEDDETSSVVNGVSFNDIMDYTSRIVNLNQESQDQVMSLLDDLSSEDSEFSDEQKAAILKYNLGEILSNSDNYNRISFFA